MKLLSFLSMLLYAFPAFAQKSDRLRVEMSAPYENERKRTYVKDIFQDSIGHIYLVKSEDKVTAGEVLFGPIADKDPTVLIEKYDQNLKQIYSLPLSVGMAGEKTVYYNGVYVINRHPYFFSSYFDKEKDMRYMFRQELTGNGKLSKAVKVAEMESKKGGGRFNIVLSPDSTLLAVVTRPAVKGKSLEEITFTVYDSKFQVVRKGATTFPYIHRDMGFRGLSLTNQGDFSALISYEHDKNKDGKQFSEEMFIFPAGEDVPRRVVLDLGRHFLLDFQVNADKEGNLYGVGLYNLTEKRRSFKNGLPPTSLGTVWLKIDRSTWKPSKPVLNPYMSATKTFMESKSSLMYGYGFQYFNIFKTWLAEDGRVYLDMEQDWTIETQGKVLHSVNNYSEMIVLIQFDPTGKVENEVIVPHKITGGGTVQGLFHTPVRMGDTFFFLYNDNAKNFRKEFKTVKDIEAVVAPGSSGIALKSNKPHVVLCTVGPDGKKTFDSVFDFKEVEVFLHTPDVLMLGKNRLLVVGSYDRDFRLFKLEIAE